MRIDWVPFSASALVLGATALTAGSLLMPSAGDSANPLQIVKDESGMWIAVAVLYFLASVAMTIGLPAILLMMDRRASRLGITAVAVFAVGCIGIAGFAMLLAFFRALVLNDAIRASSVDQLTQDAGLAVFLYGWIAAFFLGELLLAIAFLRSRSVPRWIPALLLLHILTLPLGQVLPDRVSSATVVLITIAFAAVGIRANNRHLVAA